MQHIFAIEAVLFIVAAFALIVALVARFRWRWLRYLCWLLLVYLSLAPAWGNVLEAHHLKRLNAEYPTLMELAWASLAALNIGVTLFPLVGFWRRGENKVPIAQSWRLLPLAGAAMSLLILFALTVLVRDVALRRRIARDRLVSQVSAALLAPPDVDPEEDAAPIYFRIYDEVLAAERYFSQGDGERQEALAAKDVFPAWLKDVDAPNFDLAPNDVRAFRERHRAAVTAIVAASKLPRAALRQSSAQLFGAFPQERFRAMDTLCRLVVLESRQRANEHDATGCWECLSALSRLGRHTCEQRQELWFQLSRLCGIYRARAAESILFEQRLDWGTAQFPLPGDIYVSRVPAMQAAQLDAAEILEITCANDLCELDRDDRLYNDDAQNVLYQAGPVRQLYALYSRVFELADGLRTYHSALEFCEQLAEPNHQPSSDDVGRITEMTDFPNSKLVKLAFMGTPVYYAPSVDTDARRRITDLAIAMAAFRSKLGKYPRAIEELVPAFLSEIPLDPWDGKPLRFREVDDGMLIYSVGRNQKDESGFGDLSDPGSPDITFRLGGIYREVIEHAKRKADALQNP